MKQLNTSIKWIDYCAKSITDSL